ncbi:hypothetical protein MLD38_031910 [Melastoma candidum]|uniref:Uncharacterized protein n=1 Tax=Melastoma candidum TaxID=119954 RepID=A0ACB9MR10_9MYRT|nr:hypothetical protein MLD38_031910 [Melastoma candidum]
MIKTRTRSCQDFATHGIGPRSPPGSIITEGIVFRGSRLLLPRAAKLLHGITVSRHQSSNKPIGLVEGDRHRAFKPTRGVKNPRPPPPTYLPLEGN